MVHVGVLPAGPDGLLVGQIDLPQDVLCLVVQRGGVFTRLDFVVVLFDRQDGRLAAMGKNSVPVIGIPLGWHDPH